MWNDALLQHTGKGMLCIPTSRGLFFGGEKHVCLLPTHIASRNHIFLPPLSPYVTRDTRVRFLTCGMVCVYVRLFTERDVTSSSSLPLEMGYVWEEERCVVGVRPKKKREGPHPPPPFNLYVCETL